MGLLLYMKNFTGHDVDTRAMSICARPFDCLPAFLLKIKKIQSDLFAEFPFYPAGDQVQDDLSRGADDRLIQGCDGKGRHYRQDYRPCPNTSDRALHAEEQVFLQKET